MSSASSNNGRAFEYICIYTLYDEIIKLRQAEIVNNSSLIAAEKAWNTIPEHQRELFKLSAMSCIDTIFSLEPNIVEKTNDVLKLYLQNDKRGEIGDVRDVVIERNDIKWEVGLSIKHNHMAVKHSRLAKNLDFGEKWYGIPCSNSYWQKVMPVFDFLEQEKMKNKYFADLENKNNDVYVPLLNAFMDEITRQIKNDKGVPQKLVEYLLSKYDFYKIISIDDKRITTIQSFNMFGTLNQPSRISKPKLKVPKLVLPTTLLHMGYKPNSKTTLLMCFDNGWQFSFRLHNADKLIETSLKFDITIVGIPSAVDIKFNCKW